MNLTTIVIGTDIGVFSSENILLEVHDFSLSEYTMEEMAFRMNSDFTGHYKDAPDVTVFLLMNTYYSKSSIGTLYYSF